MDDPALVRDSSAPAIRFAMASASSIGMAPREICCARSPFDELHHQGLVDDAIDLRDIRMIQRRERLRLALEAGQPPGSRANSSGGP